MIERRAFLSAIIGAACAPAIVRASSLMPLTQRHRYFFVSERPMPVDYAPEIRVNSAFDTMQTLVCGYDRVAFANPAEARAEFVGVSYAFDTTHLADTPAHRDALRRTLWQYRELRRIAAGVRPQDVVERVWGRNSSDVPTIEYLGTA